MIKSKYEIPKKGWLYKHFKGTLYSVVDIVQGADGNDLEPRILYQTLGNQDKSFGPIYSRSLDNFYENIDRKEYTGLRFKRQLPSEITRIKNLLKYYDQLLQKKGYQQVELIDSGSNREMLGHLRWMIERMLAPNWDHSEIKTNRWLGYIQGVLASNDLVGILELRDQTRPLYHPELLEWISNGE